MKTGGIDPGVTGCVAIIDTDRIGTPGYINFFDTPSYSDGNRTRIDVAGCSALIQCLRTACPDLHIFMEKVQPMPKNGTIASFSLGYSFGVWTAVMATLGVPYTLVTPQAWKKEMMPGEGKEKDASRIVAVRIFPAASGDLNLKKHHNRADAVLIAEYGRRKLLPGG